MLSPVVADAVVAGKLEPWCNGKDGAVAAVFGGGGCDAYDVYKSFLANCTSEIWLAENVC